MLKNKRRDTSLLLFFIVSIFLLSGAITVRSGFERAEQYAHTEVVVGNLTSAHLPYVFDQSDEDTQLASINLGVHLSGGIGVFKFEPIPLPEVETIFPPNIVGYAQCFHSPLLRPPRLNA